MHFRNREDAGERLADVLSEKSYPNPIIYALPRGGVAVAAPIRDRLHAPLDLVITRKIGHPHNPEYAVCAIGEDNTELCNEEELSMLDPSWLETERAKGIIEAKRRRKEYLGGQAIRSPRGRTAIVVDDGVATGLSLRLALRIIKNMKPSRLVAALPVLPPEAARLISQECDTLVALLVDHEYRGAVGAYYDEFPQLSDADVRALISPASSLV